MTLSTVVPFPGPEPPDPLAWRLTPGVRMLWRGDGSFQLEHDDGGVVVTGLDRRIAGRLARPPRPPARPGLVRPEPAPAPEPADARALLRLAELGYVRPERLARVRPAVPPRPRPAPPPGADAEADDDHSSTADGRAVGVAERGTRRATRVDVVGPTAVSAYVGALLAAAGVGTIGFATAGVVRRRHLLPGGLTVADEGRRFAAAAADVVARAAPTVDVSPAVDGEPDLVVVCLDAPMEPDLRDLLHRTRRAHLAVHVDAARGEVGPLVLPGVSACLRCADLHRLDQDPAWSVLAVQLMAQADTSAVPEPGHAARVGALAAAVALRWLDGEPTAGGTLDGSYELRPGWVGPRRRGRRPHPECGCRAAWG